MVTFRHFLICPDLISQQCEYTATKEVSVLDIKADPPEAEAISKHEEVVPVDVEQPPDLGV